MISRKTERNGRSIHVNDIVSLTKQQVKKLRAGLPGQSVDGAGSFPIPVSWAAVFLRVEKDFQQDKERFGNFPLQIHKGSEPSVDVFNQAAGAEYGTQERGERIAGFKNPLPKEREEFLFHLDSEKFTGKKGIEIPL